MVNPCYQQMFYPQLMKFGERLEAALQHLGWGPSMLSARTGVAMPTISILIKRGSNRTDYKEDLIKGFPPDQISHAWLRDETGAMTDKRTDSNVKARHREDALQDDEIEIAEYNVRFSGGNGNTVIDYELSEESEPATYRLSWLQRLKLNPDKLKRFKVRGDSMEPLLFHGDSVLVNEAENDIKELLDGKVYAIRYGNELRVKRLFKQLNGSLILRSENPAHIDEEVSAQLVHQHITIIGRVRDKSGTGGL